jgi:hypothetical protein
MTYRDRVLKGERLQECHESHEAGRLSSGKDGATFIPMSWHIRVSSEQTSSVQLSSQLGSSFTMWFRRSDARLHQGGQHLILVGVSLTLAYLLAFLTFMNQWINFWLRGSYYLSYQAIFLTLLLILFLIRLRRHHIEQLPGISLIIFGGVAGYVAGAIAFLLHPIFQENGVHQVLTTLQFPAREAAIAFFWFPVRLLSWLFGAITGMVIVLISRRIATHWLGPS